VVVAGKLLSLKAKEATMTATTHPQVSSVSDAPVYVAFEVGKRSWTVAMTSGFGVTPWVQTLGPGEWARLQRLLAKARMRFGLAPAAPVVSCYEAGRDGFWIHRGLTAQGLANRVVDSASIEVDRRARRNKTDRIDARKLATLLVRACLGEPAWREVRVPTATEEATRHGSRERTDLVREQTRLVNQMRSWLTTYGAALPARRAVTWWTRLRDYAGAPLPAEVQARLARADARLALVRTQIAGLDETQRAAVAAAPADSPTRRLAQLKGVGATSLATLLEEGLVWRAFQNRRQVGGVLGFTPTHYASGDVHRDQGISHAGNRRLQSVAIQLAWSWVKWQRASALTQWFAARFGTGKRARRIGIVAVARQLVIALWRCATTGAVPVGAVLKRA
jgi:transposase